MRTSPIWQPGRWSLLGGGREPGETLDETIARELMEEARLSIPDLTPFMVTETKGGPGGIQTVRIQVYVGRWNGDAASLPLTEGVMVHWFDADVMPRLTMCPSTEQVVLRHQQEHPGCHGGTERTEPTSGPRPWLPRPRGVGTARLPAS